MTRPLDVLRETDLRGTLSPLRRRILAEVRDPASASVVAARIGESRQLVNYHLRELEKAGLVELVETRPRRGRTERVVRASARTVVVAPTVLGHEAAPGQESEQDRFAADTLLATAAHTVDAVATMRTDAAAAGKRLVTFTITTDVGFAAPRDIARFADELAARVADLVTAFDSPRSRRRYRVVIGGHPSPPEEPS